MNMDELPPLPEPVAMGIEEISWNEFTPVLGYTASHMRAYAAAAVAQECKWREAIDDMLICQHETASDDPRDSLNRLITWHCSVQIDPLVSSAAQDLIDRGAAQERERCAKICEEIEDQAWTLWQIAADPTEQGRNIGAQHCADAIRKN